MKNLLYVFTSLFIILLSIISFAQGATNLTVDNQICVVNNYQELSQIIIDGTGGAVIVWEEFLNGNNYDISAQQVIHSAQLGVITDVDEKNLSPLSFNLDLNYPNPFNPSTKIRYSIPSSTEYYSVPQRVTLKVYDILGNEVATLVDEYKPAGVYNAQFTINNLPAGRQSLQLSSGVYFYQLKAGDFVQTKKMILLR